MMRKQVESGMSSLVGHFDLLIDCCEVFGAKYVPSAEVLRVQSLRDLLGRVRGAIDAVDMAVVVYRTAVGERQLRFVPLVGLVTRVQGEVQALGVPEQVLVHMRELVRKVQGRRGRSVVRGESGGLERHISVSQRGFSEQVGHLRMVVALVESLPEYAPEEAMLTVTGLRKLLAELEGTQEEVYRTWAALQEARQVRNKLLFGQGSGMVDTAMRVRAYVKAVFGAGSVQYKEVRRIRFHNDRRGM
jgi:hypothetical protein